MTMTPALVDGLKTFGLALGGVLILVVIVGALLIALGTVADDVGNFAGKDR